METTETMTPLDTQLRDTARARVLMDIVHPSWKLLDETPKNVILNDADLVRFFVDDQMTEYQQAILKHLMGWDLQETLDALIDLQTLGSADSSHIPRGDCIHIYNEHRNMIWTKIAEAGEFERRDAVQMVQEHSGYKHINTDGAWKEAMTNTAAMIEAEKIQGRIGSWVEDQAKKLETYQDQAIEERDDAAERGTATKGGAGQADVAAVAAGYSDRGATVDAGEFQGQSAASDAGPDAGRDD